MKASEIKVGTKIQITLKQTRKDGFVEKQVVIAEVAAVTKAYFQWKTSEVLTAENVLMPLTGGMSMFSKLEWLFAEGGYKLV